MTLLLVKKFNLSWLNNCLDLFKASGVKNADNIRLKINTVIEDNKIKFTSSIFLTPDVHRMINSLSLTCFIMKTTTAIKNAKGINFGAIPNIFKKEY